MSQPRQVQGSISMRDGVGEVMRRVSDVIYTCRTKLSEVCFGVLSARKQCTVMMYNNGTVLD